MDDLISRTQAIDAIVNWAENHHETPDGDDCIMIILDVPSAQPDVPDTNVGDLISREAMGDALNRIRVSKNETFYSFYQKALNELCKLPSAQPELQWIPCSEKPIASGKYIVTLKDDRGYYTDTAEWNPTFGGRWQDVFYDCEYRDISNVIAWMPLPKPYREDGGE